MMVGCLPTMMKAQSAKYCMTYSDFNTTCTSCSNSVTVSYSAPGSGNTMTVQKGGASVSSGDALKTCSGVTLTVTLTATTHFTVGGLSATGVTGVTTTNVGNVYTVTIPADKTGTLTLTPTFTEDAYRTIVFKSNGSALFNDGGSATTFDGTNKWKQKVYLEAKPVWPTDLAAGQACDGSSTSFRGWVAAGQTWSGKKDAVPAGKPESVSFWISFFFRGFLTLRKSLSLPVPLASRTAFALAFRTASLLTSSLLAGAFP